ncbi:MAG: hypothetical protein WED15_03610 [Akkermansiaceae bacterium]
MKKCIPAFSALALFGLAACDTMTGPLTGSGDFDPLRSPGSTTKVDPLVGATFSAGKFVQAAMDNTAFFRARPRGDADADKLLTRGTSMKVVSTSGSYIKVELDSGEVGFVPAVMLDAFHSSPGLDIIEGNPGEYQIYPPLGDFSGALPPIDPSGLPPAGSIPQVIDPEAPVPEGSLPLPPNE